MNLKEDCRVVLVFQMTFQKCSPWQGLEGLVLKGWEAHLAWPQAVCPHLTVLCGVMLQVSLRAWGGPAPDVGKQERWLRAYLSPFPPLSHLSLPHHLKVCIV